MSTRRDAGAERASRASRGSRASATAAAVVAKNVPPWVDRLPAPFRSVLYCLVYDAILPGDDQRDVMRKTILGLMPLAAIAIAALGALTLVGLPGGSPPAQQVAGFTYLVNAVGLLIVWVVMKVNPTRSVGAFDAALAITVVCLLVSAITDVGNVTATAAMQLAVIPVMLRSNRAPIVLLGCLAVMLVSMYNDSVLSPCEGTMSRPLAAVPDALVRTRVAERMVGRVVALSIAAILCAFVSVQVREYSRQLHLARASVAVASELADALAQYDTDAARARIDAARAGRRADAELMDRFDAIVSNLNRYRPHLPNWLMDLTVPEPPAGGTGGVGAGRGGGAARGPGGAESSTSLGELTGGQASGNATYEAINGQQQQRSGARSRTPLDGAPSNASFGALPPQRRAAALQQLDSMALGGAFRLRIVFAEVTFRLPSVGELREYAFASDNDDAKAKVAAAAHGFVDRIHQLASSTSGAVHSFVGDVVRVSWNAAAKAVQPEAKAARFLARLKHDAGHELARAWGAAAHGDARVQLAGTAGQQKALLVSHSFQDALQSCCRLAQRYRTFIVDAPVFTAGSHAVAFRGAGLASAKRNLSSRSSRFVGGGSRSRAIGGPSPSPSTIAAYEGLFEVMAEREAVDEWLAVLNSSSGAHGDVDARLCEAVEAATGGHLQLALQMLRSVTEASAECREYVLLTPILQHLSRQLERLGSSSAPGGGDASPSSRSQRRRGGQRRQAQNLTAAPTGPAVQEVVCSEEDDEADDDAAAPHPQPPPVAPRRHSGSGSGQMGDSRDAMKLSAAPSSSDARGHGTSFSLVDGDPSPHGTGNGEVEIQVDGPIEFGAIDADPPLPVTSNATGDTAAGASAVPDVPSSGGGGYDSSREEAPALEFPALALDSDEEHTAAVRRAPPAMPPQRLRPSHGSLDRIDDRAAHSPLSPGSPTAAAATGVP